VSFRRRLIVLASVAVAVAVLVSSGIAYLVVRGQLRGEIDSSLQNDSNAVFSIAVEGPAPGTAAEVAQGGPVRKLIGPGAPPTVGLQRQPKDNVRIVVPKAPLGGPAIYAQVVNVNGQVTKPPGLGFALPPTKAVREVAMGTRPAFFSDTTLNGVHARVYTRRTGPNAALQAVRSLDEVDRNLQRLAILLAAVSLGGVALAALLGFAVARRAVRPVARLTAAAEEVAHTQDLTRRIDSQGSDEISRLAVAFNEMLAALEGSVTAQRQLVADASHELRTPLTSLRTNIEVLARTDDLPAEKRKELTSHVVAQLEELSALVAALVDLARDGDDGESREELRLDLLVEEVVARAMVRSAPLDVVYEHEPCVVVGAESALQRAVANLLDNAAKWSPAGAPVEVRVTAAGQVSVRDRGPGVEDEDIAHVFDRFYRAASARGLPGSGLGLAIVRQVADAHGGSVSVSRAEGGGACFRLTLPVLDRPPAAAEDAALLLGS
jgi:two-component system sensor histidine kinase MprB